MNENETPESQPQQDILETLRFPEISVEQLLHIRLMHTNFLLKDTTLELGRTQVTLKQAQNSNKNLKDENRKLLNRIKELETGNTSEQ